MKIVPPENVASLCEQLHTEGGILVFTNGVFDLIHPGHIHYLREARRLGSHLIVALNTDDSTRKIKGEKRPLMSLEDRAEILAAMEMISYVTWFNEETPENIIRKVKPDVLVKGGDWRIDQIAGREFVESYGGQVFSIPFVPGYSTSNIVETITKLPKGC
jgi:rfaE bifunctional protein nucleotidyltransferase chain/domain